MLEVPTMIDIIFNIVDDYNMSTPNKIAYLGSIRGTLNGRYDSLIDTAIMKVLFKHNRYHKTE